MLKKTKDEIIQAQITGRKIREMKNMQGIKTKDIATHLGLSLSHFDNLMAGRYNMKPQYLTLVAKYLGKRKSYFL